VKVSEWLRRYQITGEPGFDTSPDPEIAYWAGWLIGTARRSQTIRDCDDARDMAIRAAEFIEARAKE
jgi:hypothetical protein